MSGEKLATAVMRGGNDASDAVAALLYANKELQCLAEADVDDILKAANKGETVEGFGRNPCIMHGPACHFRVYVPIGTAARAA